MHNEGFPSSRCASATKIVRPLESTADTQPQLQPPFLRLPAIISQYFTRGRLLFYWLFKTTCGAGLLASSCALTFWICAACSLSCAVTASIASCCRAMVDFKSAMVASCLEPSSPAWQAEIAAPANLYGLFRTVCAAGLFSSSCALTFCRPAASASICFCCCAIVVFNSCTVRCSLRNSLSNIAFTCSYRTL
jgi:hypothetical protein